MFEIKQFGTSHSPLDTRKLLVETVGRACSGTITFIWDVLPVNKKGEIRFFFLFSIDFFRRSHAKEFGFGVDPR